MLERVCVWADFDWLEERELIGTLGYERLRGADCYGFEYDRGWIKRHPFVQLGHDLQNYPGVQYTRPGRDIFGCFSDAMPDRWGRRLLACREQLAAAEDHRPARRLTSYDMLMGIDDYSRMGGFRFRREPDGEFVNAQMRFRIPPVAHLSSLVDVSQSLEHAEEKNTQPEQRWIERLVQPGSSLGGARPKANTCSRPARPKPSRTKWSKQ